MSFTKKIHTHYKVVAFDVDKARRELDKEDTKQDILKRQESQEERLRVGQEFAKVQNILNSELPKIEKMLENFCSRFAFSHEGRDSRIKWSKTTYPNSRYSAFSLAYRLYTPSRDDDLYHISIKRVTTKDTVVKVVIESPQTGKILLDKSYGSYGRAADIRHLASDINDKMSERLAKDPDIVKLTPELLKQLRGEKSK